MLKYIFTIILVVMIPVQVLAVILTWTWPNDNRVIGVKVYYGSSPYDLLSQNSIDAGFATSISLSEFNLNIGMVYFRATSYDIHGNESVPSEMIGYHNYLCGSGWSIVDSDYYLGTNKNLDFDNDDILNINDPDIDGDGLSNLTELAYYGDDWNADPDGDGFINIFDYDSDDDGINDNDDLAPQFDHTLRCYDHAYSFENSNTVFVSLTIYPVSRLPVIQTLNFTTSQERDILFPYSDYLPVSFINKGNLDELNGDEYTVTLVSTSNGEIFTQTRDIITGEIYNPSAPVITTVDSFFFYFNDSLRFAELGFCEETQRTIVRIVDWETMEIICDINVLNTDEHALKFGYYSDINGDNLPDLAISRIPTEGTPEYYSIASENQITFE